MLVIKVELHSAVTGQVTELGRMIVANDGTQGNGDVGNYDVWLARKGVTDNFKVYRNPQRKGRIEGHRRNALPVWSLISKALAAVGFNPGRKVIESTDGEKDSLHE